MSVSSTSTGLLTVDNICRTAHELAGLINEAQALTTAQAGQARRFLNIILDASQAKGVKLRTERFYDLTVTAGTGEYDLDAEVMAVQGVAMWTPAGGSSALPVRPAAQSTYHAMTPRDAEGTPFLYYPGQDGSVVHVHLWMVPSVAGTLRFRAIYLLADAAQGTDDLDTERHWYEYLTHELAAYLSRSKNQWSAARELRMVAKESLADARRESTEQQVTQGYVSHRSIRGRR